MDIDLVSLSRFQLYEPILKSQVVCRYNCTSLLSQIQGSVVIFIFIVDGRGVVPYVERMRYRSYLLDDKVYFFDNHAKAFLLETIKPNYQVVEKCRVLSI